MELYFGNYNKAEQALLSSFDNCPAGSKNKKIILSLLIPLRALKVYFLRTNTL